jgi:hypothetical protein
MGRIGVITENIKCIGGGGLQGREKYRGRLITEITNTEWLQVY